jgi:NADPH-dependent 2,4-dienoyl-CoA reductase/sulfur reductase-like enzyme
MPEGRTLVVIGGDAAGMSAASQARRRDPALEIIVYERGEHVSYAACGIPFLVGGLVSGPERLIARRPDQFQQQNIQVLTNHEVVGIDTGNRRVEVAQAGGERFAQGYDELLIATGARVAYPDIPGIGAEGVYGLRSLASGVALWSFVQSEHPKRAVIIGGGYVGLEVAEALRLQGIETALVHRGAEVMANLDPDMGALASQALRDIGVTVYLNEAPTELMVTGRHVSGVQLSIGVLPTEMVVLGTGALPNGELAGAAGIPLGVRGCIRVDGTMRTAVPHVWAAGDCAETIQRVTGSPYWVALGSLANKMGRVAGLNLTGGAATFPGVLGTAITRVGATEIARTGLNERECVDGGFDYAAVHIQDSTLPKYYPGASEIHVKLCAEKGTGRLLGAQIVGGPGSGKRIDTVAACLTGGLTVQDLLDMDLAYAPPFSPVWDPVQTAARVLLSEI